MAKDQTKLHLRILAVQTCLVFIVAILLSPIGHFDGDKANTSLLIVCIFVGLIGVSAYQAITHLNKRVSGLEQQADARKHETASGGDEKQS